MVQCVPQLVRSLDQSTTVSGSARRARGITKSTKHQEVYPMAEPISPTSLIHPSRIPNRWIQLIAGIVAMMAIANLQYAWTLFTKPIQAHLHVTLVAFQWTFTLFIALETWLVPFEGYLVDR